uniref:Assembly factor for spindle microtubules n=1 Tax=Scophthalmus maximus TaxID=52904 RepID=A0A8D3BA84_SCOMX
MSFSTYTARRKLNRLRRSACQLFTSAAMVKAIQRLELEVEAKRLLVRKDRHLWKDIGERRKVLNWLLSYNPLWMRIGLETIFGELISLESNSDGLGLAMFILQRLLWNPDIAAQFRHAKVPHLYKDGHEEALSRFTLKKLLLLVCFLDKAKESRLIEHDPCLFCVDAEFKTSKDLLLAFSRDFLSGEGILPRHLGYLGLPVTHVQKPLDEFNFAVKNLALFFSIVGFPFRRVMELLIQDWSLSAKLRLPAISRLQKVHNVDVALQVLKSKGLDLKDEHGAVIDSRDVVDGHREKTLSLLWKIIFAFHVILDEDQLREEIGFLKRTLSTKRRLVSLRADRGLQPSPAKTRQPQTEHSSTKINLLMDWARAVGDFYSLKVENFTVTFSDGRVLCYLIHHYHPGLLPEVAVSHSTTQTVECSPRGRLELSCSASDSDSSFDSLPTDSPSVEFKELLENEKNNFRLVNNAVAFLGGVPAMINPADMSNTIPNEKVVMSYLTFLCARLLDLRNETRAARVIQGAWRKYRLKKDLQGHAVRKQVATARCAAVVIQRWFRATAKRDVQRRAFVRMRCAAVTVQAAYRGKVAREFLARRHKAASVIQAAFRRCAARRRYLALRRAAVVIQQKYRATVLARETTGDFQALRRSALVIQAHWRGRADRKRMETRHKCAALIQAHYRRHRAQAEYRSQKAAAVVIQRQFRAYVAGRETREAYLSTRAACVALQAGFRGMRVRKDVIQRSYRTHCERRNYLTLKSSVLTVQRRYRATVAAKVQRTQYLELRSAAIVLQAAYRGQKVRREVAHWHRAATVIQSMFRKHREEVKFQAMRLSAVIIQRHYRSLVLQKQERERFLQLRQSAVVLQAAFRGHRQSAFRRRRWAACVFQQRFRAQRQRDTEIKHYQEVRKAAIVLQAAYRGMKSRRNVKQRHQAASVLQRVYRAHSERKQYLKLKLSVLAIQRKYRATVSAKVQRTQYLETRSAAIVLQARWSARRHDAASVIQQAVRRFLLLRRQQRVEQGIVKAQALWRGHRSRRLNDKPKVVRLRHRLRQVSAAVREEDKLCNKTSSALDYLLRYKHFSYILEALKNLETATRLSPECCERLVGSGATNVIFTLIRCCNRSVPCMDVITFSIQILLNLSKYHKTIEAVYSVENSVETLLDLLQRYREKAGDKVAEKGGGIFTKACFLLALLLQDQHRAAVRWLLRHANSNKLTGLKHERVDQRELFYSGDASFAPDWVLRKDKLQDIVDPLRAIQMVADKLSIVL